MSQYEKFLEALCEMSRSFGAAVRSEEVLNLLVEKAVQVMGVKAASLWLMDAEKDEFRRMASRGLSDAYLESAPLCVTHVPPTVEQEGYFFALDATTDSRLKHHEAYRAEGIASVLVVPLRTTGRLFGVLTMYTSEPKEFSAEEIQMATILADQVAMTIDRTRLLESIRKNTRIFLDLAKQISSSLDIKLILQTLTEDVANSLEVKGATIRLLDEESQELKLVASHGLSKDYLDKGPISSEKSISKALKGEPVVVEDASKDPGVQYRKEKKKEGIVSILCAPIIGKDKVIGVMRLYSATRRPFTPEEIMMVSALAQQGGLAIQNASMYLSLQYDMKDLQEDVWGRSLKSWF